MRMKNSVVTLLLICLLSTYSYTVNASAIEIPESTATDTAIQKETPPELLAEAAVLIEAETGRIIYAKNMNTQHEPASITKIMTTILALEHSQPDEIVKFSRAAVLGVEAGSSIIGMREGEEITMSDSLLAIMLMSANEVSAAVAEHVGGTLENFVDMMNKKAEELGCTNTNFVNPHGLPNVNQYTSAYDMALIMQEALRNPEFCKIISTFKHQIQPTNIVDEIRYLANRHDMYRTNTKYTYDGCIGGKTGYTISAMHTLVTAAKRNDMTLIAVTLKDTKYGKYTDTTDLFDYGFNNFNKVMIFDKDAESFTTNVTQFIGSEVTTLGIITARPAESLTAVLQNDINTNDLEKVVNIPESVKPPVYEGDAIGSLDFYYEGQKVSSVELIAENSIEEFTFLPEYNENEEVTDALAVNEEIIEEEAHVSRTVPIIVGATMFFAIVAFLVYTFIKKRRNRYNVYSFKKFK